MATYLYNVETTYAVEADSEEEAYEILNDGGGDMKDRDVLLVEIED